ncbi:MAG: DUF1792 domain-containing protein [Pararhodobacter sp.]|nr:DUF1792 domain-containing protein [Pararhodobacter sp.]
MAAPRKNITDILCIGCQKGSTSWLHSVLARHPDTWPFPDSHPQTSTNKEAHFWDRNHARGVDWYRRLMTPPDPHLKSMDFTPEYAFLPDSHVGECKRLNPDAKVIYILRDPLARAVSALRMRMLWRFGASSGVRLEMGKLLFQMLPHAALDQHGSYVRNFETWRRHYPDMLVLNYEELHAKRANSVARIMAFAGLDAARLTGEHRTGFDAIMAGRVWESEKFPVDRDVLIYLQGFTARTRAAVRNTFGFEFTEGQQMLDAALPVPAPHQPESGNDMNSLKTVLEQIRDETLRNREVASAQSKLMEHLLAEVRAEKRVMRLILDSATSDMENEISATLRQVQLDMARTLDAVHAERLSLARFGDGELMLMANEGHSLRFQRNSPELRRELTQAMNPDWLAPGRVLVTLPPPFRGNLHWLGVWIATWPLLKTLIDPTKQYGNTQVSRPAFFQQEGATGIAQWRRLWQGREVLVVTGRGSRFELLPELFDGADKVEFMHTAPEHAFSDREEILKGIVGRATSDTIVLLSLGPTATILAHRIAAAGLQALDIGHISASYAHVFTNGLLPEKLQTSR